MKYNFISEKCKSNNYRSDSSNMSLLAIFPGSHSVPVGGPGVGVCVCEGGVIYTCVYKKCVKIGFFSSRTGKARDTLRSPKCSFSGKQGGFINIYSYAWDSKLCKGRTGSVPCDRGVGSWTSESQREAAFIRLAQGVVDTIWLDLGALNQGYGGTWTFQTPCTEGFLWIGFKFFIIHDIVQSCFIF